MLAYCTALAVPVGWLVYAQGAPAAAVRQVQNTKITIITYPLDLTDDPDGILSQVGVLARRRSEPGKPDGVSPNPAN